MQPLRIYIGYDNREPVTYHVCAHSILMRASEPISITPLRMDTLREQGSYWRPRDERAATEFSLTRFLVPYLSGFEGWSIFMDCDMLVRTDLINLMDYIHPEFAVNVCQHDYVPKSAVKMDGQKQEAYPRKNWSSFMVFHNAACTILTPEYVNTASPADLHRFKWVEDAYGPNAIGELPLDFNWLVGEYEPKPDARILHYTNGGPWFRDYEDCDHADLWRKECASMTAPYRAGYSKTAWERRAAGVA